MMIKGNQIYAARALLGWLQRDLAARTEINQGTLCTYEKGMRVPHDRLGRIKGALEGAGIEFLNASEGSEGVLLRNGQNGVGD